jgi:glycolate oxidase FAD binding subunit
VEKQLALRQQMLAFEPPHFGTNSTIGGMVACGLSGPRRPYAGSVRDAVLGVHLINGRAEYLCFGGQVMKNVAGYDVSRLMTGAFGTLGILTQITLRVMPRPPAESTIVFELPAHEALQYCQKWSGQCTPITATYYDGSHLYVRLSGTHESLRTTQQQYGGESVDWGDLFWHNLREQTDTFFHQELPLWRLILPRSAEWPRHIPGNWTFEWNGGLRWLSSDVHAEMLRAALQPLGGHATLFRRGKNSSGCAKEIFHPLSPGLQRLHQRIRQAFDPEGIFNPHCLFAGDV